MTNKTYIIGVDIGGTNIRVGLVNEEKQLKEFNIEPIQKMLNDGKAVEHIIDFINNYKDAHKKEYNIIGVAIGFPSIIDRDRRVILSTPNIEGLDNVAIVDAVEKALGIPVFIDQDVNMLLRYDMFVKQISEQGISVGFYIGTGLGNAISINGEVLIGKNGAAAELGHIPSKEIKGKCGCGNTSCIELVASGKHLMDLCVNELDDVFIKKVFVKYNNSPVIKEFIYDLAIPLSTEINILDPDNIIIGGGVVHMEAFPKELFEKAIREYVRKPYPERNLIFIYAEEGQANGVIGAGIYGFKKYKEDKNQYENRDWK